MKGGRLEFRDIYVKTLPIPDAQTAERNAVAKLAKSAQELHTHRRAVVETFLYDIGTSPALSSSRNPLEQPWALTPEEFTRRIKKLSPAVNDPLKVFKEVRDETAALTEEIQKAESGIDARVAELYGVEID